METTDLIQFWILIITAIGVLITAIALIITLRNFKRQLQLSFFADYTKRYQEIILNLPLNIYSNDFDYDQLDKETKKKTLKYMRVYFDLCSEEYDLFLYGNLEKRIWKEWKEGMRAAFSKPAFLKAWKKLNLGSIYYKNFNELVEELTDPKNLQN